MRSALEWEKGALGGILKEVIEERGEVKKNYKGWGRGKKVDAGK